MKSTEYYNGRICGVQRNNYEIEFENLRIIQSLRALFITERQSFLSLLTKADLCDVQEGTEIENSKRG